MTAIAQGLFLGALVGAVFAAFHLAPPSPASWAGVAGIAGILAGWQIVGWLR